MQLQVETKLYKDNAIDNALDKAAREYITYIDESVGVQVHDKATVGSPYHDYVQVNSTDISMWRANKKMMSLNDNALEFYYNGDTDNPIARYGEAINLYKIGTQVPVVTINQDGATFEGTINAIDGNLSNSVTIGGKEQSDYLNSNVQIGNLLRLTPRLYEKNEYLGYQLNLTENLIGGETYTLQFWGLTLDDNSEGIELFWGGDIIPLTSEPLLPDENGYLSYTFKVTSVTSNNAWINIYNVPEEEHNDKNISIVRWKLEKGSVAKAWSLAAEDMESTYSCICDTAAANEKKVATCDNFILNVGTVVAVKFINGNNCTAAMELNVGGTGSKKVLMVGNIEASSTNVYRYNLSLNTTVTFVYDGENWRITGDNQLPAQITHIDSGGISIHPVGDINQRLDITTDGIDIRKNDESIAFYGQATRIGKENSYHTSITSNGVSIWSGTEQTQTEGINRLALFGNSIIFYKPGTNIPVTTLDTNGLKIYKDGNLKGDFNSTITLYGGNTATGTYPKVEISSSAITIAKTNEYKTLINDSGLQIHVGNSINSVASFGSTVRIGNSGKERVEITDSSLEIFDGGGHRRVYVDSSNGIILGWNNDTTTNRGYVQVTDAGLTIYDQNKKKALETSTSGLMIYKGGSLRATFGDTVVLQSSNGTYPRVAISSTEAYFQTSASSWATMNGSGLVIHQDGIDVSSFGATVTVGKTSGYYIQLDSNAVTFGYNSSSLGTIVVNGAYMDIRKGGGSLELDNQASRISAYTAWNNCSIASTTAIDTGRFSIYLNGSGHSTFSDAKGLEFEKNYLGIWFHDSTSAGNAGGDLDCFKLGADNNLVMGLGSYQKNASGYDTYIEGYNVMLRARNKCYLGSPGGTQITSDKRLKKDIVSITDSIIPFFMSLDPVMYKLENSADKQKHFGFIAQDVEKAFLQNGLYTNDYSIVDEYIFTETDEHIHYKSLCYTEFIPLCVKMIQNQYYKINQLEEELNALRSG